MSSRSTFLKRSTDLSCRALAASSQNVPLASEKFLFSVIDKEVADSLTKLTGNAVTVHYKQKNGKLMWRGDTEYFVDKVTRK